MFKILSAKYYVIKKWKKGYKKKREYRRERYKNYSEDEKQNLVEYRKNIIDWEKMLYYNYKKVF